ncbi:MAG: hypothetical protein U0176_15145 [Bacteroidia bacterium]
MADDLKQAGTNSAVIYLGDNIYDYGLPADSHLTARRWNSA